MLNSERRIYPQRVDLSTKQREWICRMWTWASVAILGMRIPCLPDLIPNFTCDGRLFYVPVNSPNLHHIIPAGESLRLLGRSDYNRPDNIVPINNYIHIGKAMRWGDPREDEVIHPDSMEALRKYGGWAKAGKVGRNPMQEMHEARAKLTDIGRGYHNTIYDSHFQNMATLVTNSYYSENPKDIFPSHIPRRRLN